jgi:hypothetical protein
VKYQVYFELVSNDDDEGNAEALRQLEEEPWMRHGSCWDSKLFNHGGTFGDYNSGFQTSSITRGVSKLAFRGKQTRDVSVLRPAQYCKLITM